MKLLTEFKPELAAGNGESEYDPAFCYLDLSEPGKPVLVSTNGHILTALPVLVDDDDIEGLIPLTALTLAREAAEDDGMVVIVADEYEQVRVPVAEASFRRPKGVSFPQWRKLTNEPGSITLVVDVFLLMAAVRAMGATEERPRITLNFEPGESGKVKMSISRKSGDYQTVRGYLMTAGSE